jgi:hypothetical protein
VWSVLAAGRRHLPGGFADLGRQLGIWFGFLAVYQLARGVADRDPDRAFENGIRVFMLETELSNRFYELTIQQFVDQRQWLERLVMMTYWNSEFTVVGIALLWVYLRRHESFIRFRNSILLANMLGLCGYVLLPTAPPRLLGVGFIDRHHDGIVQLAANPYAAMPSLHAADALILGVVLAFVSRHWWARAFWIAWPAWVWFVVMATGDHFWLDCVAGVAVALLALFIVYRRDLTRTLLLTRA